MRNIQKSLVNRALNNQGRWLTHVPTIFIPYQLPLPGFTITCDPEEDEKIEVKEDKSNEVLCCIKCNTPNEFAEPNQSNGTLICWSCKNGY